MKNFLMIVLKNAINAIITNAALMAMLHGAFNVTTAAGWWNIGKATLSVVLAREFTVWFPVVLGWSSTNSNPPKMIQIPPSREGD